MNYKAWLAEFVGTFGFVFLGVASVCATTAPGAAGGVAPALAHGLALAIMITATAAVSGGHINPAVTFGALITGKIKVGDAAGYVIAQLAGALVAVKVLAMTVPEVHNPMSISGITPTPLGDASQLQVILAEAIGTFFLVFTVFGTAIDSRAPKMGGWFVGMVVSAMALSIGFVSGGSFNPARYFGPAIATGDTGNMAVYLLAPVLGGIVAALLYQSVFAAKDAKAAE